MLHTLAAQANAAAAVAAAAAAVNAELIESP